MNASFSQVNEFDNFSCFIPLDPNWQKWTGEEAKEIFARHGLDHLVWNLEATAERF